MFSLGNCHGQCVLAGKRQPTCEQLVEDDTEGVQVGTRPGFGAHHHLGRQVRRRSEHDSAVGEPVVSHEMAGDPEIRNPHPVSRTEKDVGGLDVAMDHATTVGVIERLCHSQGNAGCLG